MRLGDLQDLKCFRTFERSHTDDAHGADLPLTH
jgi:hypothetical protein